MIGRPTIYTEELGKEICARITNGEALWRMCMDAHMPDRGTIFEWANEEGSAFASNYARARQLAADAMDDDMDRIAADGGRDTIVEDNGEETIVRVDHENIQRSKLIVETLRWRASKRYPEKYGDRTSHQMLDEHGKPAKAGITIIVDGAPVEGGA